VVRVPKFGCDEKLRAVGDDFLGNGAADAFTNLILAEEREHIRGNDIENNALTIQKKRYLS